MDNPILREWLTRPDGLAAQLSAMRIRAGLSGSALARDLDWVHTKVSRIQNGRQIPTAEEIRACNSSEEANNLVDLLEQVSTQRLTWRHWLAAADGRVQNAYNELFRQSTKMSMFENESIPGVLQTPSYTTAMLNYLLPLHGIDRSAVPAEVARRMERGRYLHDTTKQFDLLITETALLSGPATADVLATQLQDMLRIMELPNVRVGVVPLTPGLPVVIVSPFSIHEVISGDVVVIGEVLHGELPNLADSLNLYRQALADLWDVAVENKGLPRLAVTGWFRQRVLSEGS